MCSAPAQAAPGRNSVADLPGRASGHRKSSPPLCVDSHPGGCRHSDPWPPGWGTKVVASISTQAADGPQISGPQKSVWVFLQHDALLYVGLNRAVHRTSEIPSASQKPGSLSPGALPSSCTEHTQQHREGVPSLLPLLDLKWRHLGKGTLSPPWW